MPTPLWGVNLKPINEGGSPLAGGVLIFGEITGHMTKAHINEILVNVSNKYFLGLGVPKNTAFWFFCANIKNIIFA